MHDQKCSTFPTGKRTQVATDNGMLTALRSRPRALRSSRISSSFFLLVDKLRHDCVRG